MSYREIIATANYDEAKVAPYTLPDPLVCQDGSAVKTADQWRGKRRAEVLRLFEDHVYGRMFPTLPIQAKVLEGADDALGGLAKRRQVRITFGGHAEPALDLLLYIPAKATRPAPCFIGLNFFGNHSTVHDPAVFLSKQWMRDDGIGVVEHRATEASRGSYVSRWPVEMILSRGYALATLYNGDIDPDYNHGFTQGVHPLFHQGGASRPSHAAGTITAWAWGLSRAMDYLQSVPEIDSRRVCVTGHSRLGKTALWAAANDERFALAVSNNSGCGGASLSRRNYGETLYIITNLMAHWWCPRCAEHAPHIETMPVDQHELIALSAPRPVFISSAEEDRWADPRGEFLAALAASPVYRLLETDGMAADQMPALNQPVMSRIGYEIRPGGHGIGEADWKVHLDFADRHLDRA